MHFLLLRGVYVCVSVSHTATHSATHTAALSLIKGCVCVCVGLPRGVYVCVSVSQGRVHVYSAYSGRVHVPLYTHTTHTATHTATLSAERLCVCIREFICTLPYQPLYTHTCIRLVCVYVWRERQREIVCVYKGIYMHSPLSARASCTEIVYSPIHTHTLPYIRTLSHTYTHSMTGLCMGESHTYTTPSWFSVQEARRADKGECI